jgi:ribonucleoside-diphosphate reductase alpha chain
MSEYGPKLPFSEETHARKYRLRGESFRECCSRVAHTLTEDIDHFYSFRDLLLRQEFLPAGRIQAAIGSPQNITALNCFVSGVIPDSMDGIMDSAKEAATTMRKGGGIGFDFSTIRPRGAIITTLGSSSSGAVSFMEIPNAVCGTVASAGDRRGAMMAVLRVDHPDIEEFIDAKTNKDKLTNFNISVGITDKFMNAVKNDEMFDLSFNGKVFRTVKATYLWEKIMRNTWDWAEPGVLFLDTINRMNNLHYCEEICTSNPCSEQPLPPYGACLLGSYNLTRFDLSQVSTSTEKIVRAMDNVIDNTTYPLEEQEEEAKSKRRIGLGVTGLANFLETSYSGCRYGDEEFLLHAEEVLSSLTYNIYKASINLAKEKGSFELFDRDKYLESAFIKTLPDEVQQGIYTHGIRNSHLISYAPTGTISITADNVSSGIEPVFSHSYTRTVNVDGIDVQQEVDDYAFREYGVAGRTANECSIDEHLAVLTLATKYSDSAVSKTINVGDNVEWEEFKTIYMRAWENGCKGVTTYRSAGKRYGVLNELPKKNDGIACYIDPTTGRKECE